MLRVNPVQEHIFQNCKKVFASNEVTIIIDAHMNWHLWQLRNYTNNWPNPHLHKEMPFKYVKIFVHDRHTIWMQTLAEVTWNCTKGVFFFYKKPYLKLHKYLMLMKLSPLSSFCSACHGRSPLLFLARFILSLVVVKEVT